MPLFIHNYIAPERIQLLESATKTEAIDALVDAIGRNGPVSDLEAFRKSVHDRERVVSTGIGLGVAVPHAKVDSVSEFFVAIGLSAAGIDWDAIDQQPVRLVFLIGGPVNDQQTYLQILSKIVLVIKSQKLRENLLAAQDPAEVMTVLSEV